MARKKAKKTAKKAKKTARKSVAKRSKTPARRTKKTARKTAARTAKASRKTSARKATKKTARRRGDVKGEGNYSASRRFRQKEEGFIKRMGRKLIGLGQDAKSAVDGPEGAELQAAEAQSRERGAGMDIPRDDMKENG